MANKKNGALIPESQHLINADFYKGLENTIKEKHENVSSFITPKAQVKRRADGFDYVEEAYMRKLLNDHYPVWSWEIKKYEFLGDKWAIVHGMLTILDDGVKRTFDAVAGHRVVTSRQTGEYVNISNDIKSANSDAFKVAVNRLCNVSDDVYRKQIVDLSLTTEQVEKIEGMLKGLDEKTIRSIRLGITEQTIHQNNLEKTIQRIEHLKGVN